MSVLASIFRPPKIPQPTVLTPPSKEDPEVEDARRKQLLLAAKLQGRQGSILTGPTGDTSKAPVALKTLLGQ